MKKRDILVAVFLICAIFTFIFINFERSYSYGDTWMQITGKAGSRVLKYYDENNKEMSVDEAVKNYGYTRYQEMPSKDGSVYFYNGKEISASKYKTGAASEQADLRASKYGSSGIRVNSTDSFKKAWDDMFLNYRIGEVMFTWSPYDNIDFNEVERYVMSKYGVSNLRQNYYKYSVKGPQEPIRFPLNLASYKNVGEMRYNNYWTRHTGDEKQRVDYFLNKLFSTEMPKSNASDYEKILASFQFIVKHARYFVDDGFVDELQKGYSSMYDVILTGNANCIGYSNAFSYFMEKYGIESYVIDGAITVDEKKQTFQSDHTYNIVKLDGKFYRMDLTSHTFLAGMSLELIPKTNLTISKSAYNTSGKQTTYNFNESNVTKYKNEAMNLKVTVTTRRALTTKKVATTKGSQSKTSNKVSNTNNPKTSDKTTTTTAYHGSTGVVIETNTIPTTSNTNTTTSSTTKKSDEDTTNTTTKMSTQEETQEDKTFGNVIMIGILVLTIVGYIVYKIIAKKNTRSSYSDEVQAILNKDIQRPDDNNNGGNNQ